MDAERYRRMKAVLHEADRLGGAERVRYLDEACGDDAQLRAAVEDLLGPEPIDTVPIDTVPIRIAGGDDDAWVQLPETVGPYDVGDELGRGAMGVVHVATDRRDGRAVALKFLYPHLRLTPLAHSRFEREVALGQKVVHENVVAALGLESADSPHGALPVMVMEYVDGRSLREALDEWQRIPEALLREIAVQVADGLAAIHAEGIVHRDLKPENVMLTDDQRIRISDLGVAKVQEATLVLTREGHFVGSLAYAAPEQYTGGVVAAPADLYAVGVLLYELATGHNPFVRPNPIESMGAHLGERPPPARQLAPDLSPFLSDVVDRLLAIEPDERFSSAAELCGVLRAAEDSEWWTARAEAAPPPVGPEVRVARDTTLHGRDEERAWLREAWAAARGVRGAGADGSGAGADDRAAHGSRGGVCFLEGEAGIGKTRLLAEFAADAAGADVHVLYGSFAGGSGLRALTDAVVAALGAERLVDELARLLDETPERAEELARLLRGEAHRDAPGGLAPDALPSLCCRLLIALARDRPTLWLVDDLQAASPSARAAVLGLVRCTQDTAALLVIASRDAPDDAELEELRRRTGASHRVMGRLTPRQVVELLEEALRSETAADRLGVEIVKRSDGVPFFVLEMVRAAREAGHVRRDESGNVVLTHVTTALEVPDAVRDVVAARAARLERADRETLDIAAVIGPEFDARTLAAVRGHSFVRVLQDLTELERRHGVIRSVGRRHRFDHHELRQMLYEELPPMLREEYHALVAEAHEELASESDGATAYLVASHHLRGSRPARAVAQLDAALAHLDAVHATADAADLLTRAVEANVVEPGARAIELKLRLAGKLHLLSRREAQESVARVALEAARALDDPALMARCWTALGLRAHAAFETDLAVERYETAIRCAREAHDEAVEFTAAHHLARSLSRLRRDEEAATLMKGWLRIGERDADPLVIGRASLALASLFAGGGRWRDARDAATRATETLDERGDLSGECSAYFIRAGALLSTGEFEAAVADLERVEELALRDGSREMVAKARGRIGLISLQTGELAKAQRCLRHQLETGLTIGDPNGIAQAFSNLAYIETAVGSTEMALEYAHRALAEGAATGNRKLTCFVEATSAYALRNAGEFARSYEAGLRALDAARNNSDRAFEGVALLELGATAYRQERRKEALDHLRRARDIADSTTERQVGCSSRLLLAQLGDLDVDEVVEFVSEHVPRIGRPQAMDAHFALWKLTGDRDHLQRSHEHLMHMRDHAPEPHRETMIERVPLHRDIAAAWAAGG